MHDRLDAASASSRSILVAAIAANVLANMQFPAAAGRFPFIGAAVWVVILLTAPLAQPGLESCPATFAAASSCCRWC